MQIIRGLGTLVPKWEGLHQIPYFKKSWGRSNENRQGLEGWRKQDPVSQQDQSSYKLID